MATLLWRWCASRRAIFDWSLRGWQIAFLPRQESRLSAFHLRLKHIFFYPE